MAGREKRAIVIRKEEVVEGGHHGGAWKVAYADFVTAMMAFFLLMWLLNATTEQQRKGIADYFNPNPASISSASGYGQPFGGRTPNVDGALASDRGVVQVGRPQAPVMVLEDDPDETDPAAPHQRQATAGPDDDAEPGQRPASRIPPSPASASASRPPAVAERSADPGAGRPESAPTDAELQAELDRRERQVFERAAQQIRDAVRTDPALADLAKQLMIDVTPEGLRVQLVDEDKQPMFATGSAAMNERARALLAKIGPVLARLPQGISISGHTDSTPYKGGDRSNWDLSADRANATRRLLVDAGVPEARLRSVTGKADRDPLLPGDTAAAVNRRIAITVLHDSKAGAR